MYAKPLQTLSVSEDHQERERAVRLHGVLTVLSLHDENRLYAKTQGISQCNRSGGFCPGYLNLASGESVLSRFSDGSLAPVHVLDGLPDAWVIRRDAQGRVIETSAGIISGFIRDGVFYTRDEAIRASTH